MTVWNDTLIGYAIRGGYKDIVIPVYGYQAIKALLKDKGFPPAQAYSLIHLLFTNKLDCEYQPAILYRYTSKPLWQKINNEAYPRWEYLDRAIVGLISTLDGDKGIAYSKTLCVEILQNTSSSISNNYWENYLANNYKLENTVINLSLGDKSPFFITQIK